MELVEINVGNWGPPIVLATDDAILLSNDILGLMNNIASKRDQAQKSAEVLLTGGLVGTLHTQAETKNIRFGLSNKQLVLKQAGLTETTILEKPLSEVTGWVFGVKFKEISEPTLIFGGDTPLQTDVSALQLIIK